MTDPKQDQDMTDPNQSTDTPSPSLDDVWASALAEQHAATQQAASQAGSGDAAPASLSSGQGVSDGSNARPATSIFQPLDGSGDARSLSDIQLIMDVPVKLTVELGRTKLTIKNLLQLGQGSVVELDSMAGEPMDIFVNGYLIAQGEVVVVDDKYGIRLTDIITPSERISRLSRG